jgi:hypothetical protein
MNKYYRDIILIGIYGFCVVCQLIFSSYLINKKNDLTDILQNYKNIDVCRNDAIYRLNNGELINNTMAILISGSIIIGSFIILFFYKILSKRNDYEILNDSVNSYNSPNSSERNESIISRKLITLEKFDMTIHMIFIMSIICFVICNGIQFVFQINNISDSCIHYIDNRINNFYTIYKFMTIIDFMTSYALFFVIPCFL